MGANPAELRKHTEQHKQKRPPLYRRKLKGDRYKYARARAHILPHIEPIWRVFLPVVNDRQWELPRGNG